MLAGSTPLLIACRDRRAARPQEVIPFQTPRTDSFAARVAGERRLNRSTTAGSSVEALSKTSPTAETNLDRCSLDKTGCQAFRVSDASNASYA